MSDELKRMAFAKMLSDFTSDDLLEELARRESGDGRGGVLHWRVRAVFTDHDVMAPEYPVRLSHDSSILFNGKMGKVRMEAMIDGEWRGQDWIRDSNDYTPQPRPIHKGVYD